jgi:NAD-dependent deacetylase
MSNIKLVVLTGAGISQESGLKTFRDQDGLWENHRVEEVATPEAWANDPELVLRFYNERRRQLNQVVPNAAHKGLADLQDRFEVAIITQNVDDLHERAGSRQVLHLHGSLKLARSTYNPNWIVPIEEDLKLGDTCPDGGQLRPHIVWFGEPVPAMETAAEWVHSADLFLIVGTSLQVYPAAGLYHYTRSNIPIVLIDPHPAPIQHPQLLVIPEVATIGVPQLVKKIANILP